MDYEFYDEFGREFSDNECIQMVNLLKNIKELLKTIP